MNSVYVLLRRNTILAKFQQNVCNFSEVNIFAWLDWPWRLMEIFRSLCLDELPHVLQILFDIEAVNLALHLKLSLKFHGCVIFSVYCNSTILEEKINQLTQ